MFFTYMIFYGVEAASRSASLYVYNLLREQLLVHTQRARHPPPPTFPHGFMGEFLGIIPAEISS